MRMRREDAAEPARVAVRCTWEAVGRLNVVESNLVESSVNHWGDDQAHQAQVPSHWRGTLGDRTYFSV